MARSKMPAAPDLGKHTSGRKHTSSKASLQQAGAFKRNLPTPKDPAGSSGTALLLSSSIATSSALTGPAEAKKGVRAKGSFSPQELLQRGQNAYRESRRSLLVAQSRLCYKKWRLYIYLLQEEAIEGVEESSCRLQLAYRTAYRIWLVSERNLWSKQRKKFRFLLGVDQQNLFQDHDNTCEMPLQSNVQA